MATFLLPDEQNRTRQVNEGDVFGEFWATFNLDLSTNPGKIKTSRWLTPTMTAAKMGNDDLYTLAMYKSVIHGYGSSGHRWSIPAERNVRLSGNWSSSTAADDYGIETDSVVFGDLLLISGGTDIISYNGSTYDTDYWTNVLSGTALTNGVPHTLEVIRSGQETVFVTDNNLVRYYNSTSGHASFTLNAQHVACALTSSLDRVWAGTYSESGNALVYELQVGNTIATNAYEIDAHAVLSMVTVGNTPYILTDKGDIKRFNGVGFVTVASFPFSDSSVSLDGVFPGVVEGSNIARAVHPRGMRSLGDSIYIYINTKNELIDQLAANPLDEDDIFDNTVVDERSPAGIWEFNVRSGILNHRYALPYDTTNKTYQVLQQSSPILLLDNQYSRILVGSRTETDRTEICVEDYSVTPTGYFITREFEASAIVDEWEHITLKARTLQSGETITVKYRTTKNPNYPQYSDITWLDANRFTCTDANMANVQLGDEVEIISGYRSGSMPHITAIEGTTTYTVTVDEAIGSMNQTSRVRFQNWTKIDDHYTENDGEWKQIGLNVTAPWIQFKVVMSGDIELRRLIVKSNMKERI